MGPLEVIIVFLFAVYPLLISAVLWFYIKKIKKDILLIARNPPKAKRTLLNDPRYKNL